MPRSDASVESFDSGLENRQDASSHDAALDASMRDGSTHECRDGLELIAVWPFEHEDIPVPESRNVSSTPLALDVFPSLPAQPELVFVTYQHFQRYGYLRIVDFAAERTITAGDGGLAPLSTPAIGDIDGDGRADIVAVGRRGGLLAFEFTGELKWRSRYPLPPRLGYASPVGGAPAIADLEGDGNVEIIYGPIVLDGTSGELRWSREDVGWQGTNYRFGPLSCVADLDGDGDQEVIAGKRAYRADGSLMWELDLSIFLDGFCGIAEIFSESAGPEVVLHSRGYLRVVGGRNGDLLWTQRVRGRGRPAAGGAPAIADFDGDGRAEIAVAEVSAFGIYDPECTEEDPKCSGEGVLYSHHVDDASHDIRLVLMGTAAGSSAFDFDADGISEAVHHDERWLRVFDEHGTRWGTPSSLRTNTEYSIVVDADGDGSGEIVAPSSISARFLERWETFPGISIWDRRCGEFAPAGMTWNQHTYHGTNIHSDGTVPEREVPSWEYSNTYRGMDFFSTE